MSSHGPPSNPSSPLRLARGDSSDVDWPDLSIVAPAHNEQENVGPLAREVAAAMLAAEIRFELIIVDDGSTDQTLMRLRAIKKDKPWMRVVCMAQTPPGRGHGQSAAFKAGIAAARGRWIAVMDADLQNDPADLPAMIRVIDEGRADLVQGDRSGDRRDHFGRRAASWVGRAFRRIFLGDPIRDTGCSLRVMRREVAFALPLEFHGMHRFIPLTARHCGFIVVEMPVKHRPRIAGKPKYGVFNRALPGLLDGLAMMWMRSRRRPTRALDVHHDTGDSSAPDHAQPGDHTLSK